MVANLSLLVMLRGCDDSQESPAKLYHRAKVGFLNLIDQNQLKVEFNQTLSHWPFQLRSGKIGSRLNWHPRLKIDLYRL